LKTIYLEIKGILLKKGVPFYQIKDEAIITSDLGLDSLDLAELIVDIEKRFDIFIDETEWANVVTVANLTQYVIRKKFGLQVTN
jgi:acyl carrier protein